MKPVEGHNGLVFWNDRSSRVQGPDTIAIVREKAAGVFARYPGVQAVYLFGSVAAQRQLPESDLDLGLVVTSPLGQEKLDILADLVRAGFEKVDLVELDQHDLTMRYEAVRPNQLVYARPEFDHASYFSLTLREYFDFLPYLERHRRAYRRRLIHGQA